MDYEIAGRFTFYGCIPDDSIEQHLGIVLGVKDALLKYCYCTSKKYKHIILNEVDFIKIPAAYMNSYFKNPQDTFIYLSQQYIIDMFLVTFERHLSNSEYEVKEQISTEVFVSILSKIQNSNNLSERFKNEFFAFIE